MVGSSKSFLLDCQILFTKRRILPDLLIAEPNLSTNYCLNMATMGWSPESVPTPGESNSSGTINESELKRVKNNTMMAEVAPTRAATAVIARELFKEKDNMSLAKRLQTH